MKVLIMMLLNTAESTYHPIFYMESPLPGDNSNIGFVRYKSKGHRTTGFKSIDEALESIQTEIVDRLDDNYSITKELKGVLEWDGKDIPADIQIRSLA